MPTEIVSCPECGHAAEVVDRDFLPSTDGLVEHVRLRCVQRHWFYMPADSPMLSPRLHHDTQMPKSLPTRAVDLSKTR
jgi:hypothetical protein